MRNRNKLFKLGVDCIICSATPGKRCREMKNGIRGSKIPTHGERLLMAVMEDWVEPEERDNVLNHYWKMRRKVAA